MNTWKSYSARALALLTLPLVEAHTPNSETTGLTSPLVYIAIASIIVIGVVLVSIVQNKRRTFTELQKETCFRIILIVVIAASIYLVAHTLYLNATSVTRGPVHWHADYQVWACGERLDLINPRFPSNKIGTPILHEHNDDRIHVEGTISDFQDISLSHFFEVIGGGLAANELAYPTAKERVSLRNNDQCNGKPATLKVYVNGKRIDAPQDHILYPSSYVPPGDCIIINFDETTSLTTTQQCESWRAKNTSYESFKRPEITIRGYLWP